ncbi:MAG: DUF4131 domain-containing protein [Rhodospirillaceae bacterium]|nr:DUF4131 domain-containing protein [Rhodospirillaceae bacterium]
MGELVERDRLFDPDITDAETYIHAAERPAWLSWINAEFSRQAPNAVLWWPACLAIGIGLLFSLPVDPPVWVGGPALILASAFHIYCRTHGQTTIAAVTFILVMAALGFCAAQIRTHSVAAPILSEELGPTNVSGTVIQVEPIGTASRITLDRLALPTLEPNETPERVRIRIPGSHGAPKVGQRLLVRAIVRPPGRPVAPGAFDFQRYSFFKQLGGVGFSVGQWRLIDTKVASEVEWADQINGLRARVGERLAKQLPNESGAIARALVTGERNAVPESLQEAYRRAGLAHMLAISGLHMSLIAGLAFIALRFGVALIVPVAERYNTKKFAALAALGAALFYLVLSGANIPAQRAFIMIGVVFFAVLIDRTALSLRTLAWAAMVVLLLKPDALVGASFQLSFAAVIALITVYERVQLRSRLWDCYGNFQPFRALLLYGFAVLVTDLIATSATAPFTAFHFHQVPSYSLLANLLAVPIMGLWIMPSGLLALVLMPFGLEGFALIPMGAGIDAVDAIARFVADLPGSTFTTPPAQVWALVCIGVGGLVLCLWQGFLRWVGVLLLVAGLLQPWYDTTPNILINETADVLAVKGSDGALILSPGRREGFTRGVWTELWGQSEETWKETKALTCDSEACIYSAEGKTVSLSYSDAAVSEDCGRVDVIVAKVPSWRLCKSGVRIDRFDVWRHGAHALWIEQDDIRIKRVSDFTGRRIWNKPTWR